MSFASLERFVKETSASAKVKNRLKLIQGRTVDPHFRYVKKKKGTEIFEFSYQLLKGRRQDLKIKPDETDVLKIKSFFWFKPNGMFYLGDFPWKPLVEGVLDLISLMMFDDIGFTNQVTLSKEVFQKIEDWITGSEHAYPGSAIRYIFREIPIEGNLVEELNIRAISPPPILLNTLKTKSQSWEVLTFRTPGIKTKTKTIRVEKTGKITIYSQHLKSKAFFSALEKIEDLLQDTKNAYPS